MNATFLSIVVPVYRCKESLHELYSRVRGVLQEQGWNYELILVDDGCPDKSWYEIIKLCEIDSSIRGIRLSRNFGQHAAILAGLHESKGEWIVVMDGDLQDRPEEIACLVQKGQEGWDFVQARRVIRNDPFIKRFFSRAYYRILSYLMDLSIDPTVANFGVYNRKVISAILSVPDKVQYFPVIVRWVGFHGTSIPVQHEKRKWGKSAYSWYRYMQLGINVILTFSEKPLRILMMFGFLMTFVSFIVAFIFLTQAIRGEIIVMGWASIVISIWFLAGIHLFALGIIGSYLGKTFLQAKNRPIFIVDEVASPSQNLRH